MNNTLIIAATNRNNSRTETFAQYYQNLLAAQGQSSEIFSLRNLPDNLLGNFFDKETNGFADIQSKVSAADKFIFVIPEYNGGFPGVLKLFIDACTFPESFKGKKAALVGISAGKYGNVRGVEHFGGICSYCGIHTLPLRIHVPNAASIINEQREITHEDTLKFMKQQVEEFVAF